MSVQVWLYRNDMVVSLTGLRTSTMAAGSFLTNTTGVQVAIWSTDSTGDLTKRVATGNMAYTPASEGNYTRIVQSTAHSMTVGMVGMAVVTLKAGSLDAEWRPMFRVEYRRST